MRGCDVNKMTVRELYEQLKPFVEICPDEEVMIATTLRFGPRLLYPMAVDRSDWGGREIIISCITPAADDFQSRRENMKGT